MSGQDDSKAADTPAMKPLTTEDLRAARRDRKHQLGPNSAGIFLVWPGRKRKEMNRLQHEQAIQNRAAGADYPACKDLNGSFLVSRRYALVAGSPLFDEKESKLFVLAVPVVDINSVALLNTALRRRLIGFLSRRWHTVPAGRLDAERERVRSEGERRVHSRKVGVLGQGAGARPGGDC